MFIITEDLASISTRLIISQDSPPSEFEIFALNLLIFSLEHFEKMGAQQSKDELLYHEVQRGNIDEVKKYHSAGASLEWIDKEGRTPLILACMRSDLYNVAAVLLQLGANVKYYRPGSHNGTALHHAAKKGLEKTVTLLLSYGANPLAINDDCLTPLDVARTKGHVKVVRLIESHISLFSGMVRELTGPSFLGVLAPQLVSRKILAVVLPKASYNHRGPVKLELLIYSTPKVSQPRATILLSKAEIEEPKFTLQDPVLTLVDKSTKNKHRFLSECEGDKDQLRRLYMACNGVPQTMPNNAETAVPSGRTAEADAELAMAISASLQSVAQERITSPSSSHLSDSHNGWGGALGNEHISYTTSVHSGNNKLSGWTDSGASSSHNGWETPEMRPQNPNNTEAINVASTDLAPSAPPLPEEYVTTSNNDPVFYPMVDTSPVSVNLSTKNNVAHPSANLVAQEADIASGTCIICWDACAEAVCIPCGHLAGCISCLNEIKSKQRGCPVCRATIDQVIKIYVV